jgi:hypothetical protein
VLAAVTFEPAISGFWYPDNYYSGCASSGLFQRYQFLMLDSTLLPKTEYSLIISDKVNLTEGLHLPQADTFRFVTEGPAVVASNPQNGNPEVPVDQVLSLEFNTAMDTTSGREAFSLSENGGTEIERTVWWDSRSKSMTIGHENSPFKDHTVYVMRLRTTAKSLSGIPLDGEFVVYFVTN